MADDVEDGLEALPAASEVINNNCNFVIAVFTVAVVTPADDAELKPPAARPGI